MEPHKHVEPRKKRKGLWITMAILLILAVGIVGVGFWQKNNLEAMKQYTQFTQEELEQQLQDNDQQVQDILNAALEAAKTVDSGNTSSQVPQEPVKMPNETVKEPETGVQQPAEPKPEPTAPIAPTTPVEPPVIAEPSQPQEPSTVVPQVPVTPPTQAEPPPAAPEASKPTESPPVQETPVVTGPTYEEQLQAIVDRVYALRAEYLQALDDLQSEAVAAYKAIPKSQRNKKAIVNFVSTYISKATTLEKQCDGKMDVLVKELTQLQKKYGQTMELVEAVKYTYANEKSLKKAWYMSELEKRGMI